MTLKEIMNVDYTKLSDAELRDYIRSANRIANRRLTELRKSKVLGASYAYEQVKPYLVKQGTKRAPKFTQENLQTREKMIEHALQAKQFLGTGSSKVKAVKGYVKQINEKWGVPGNAKLTAKQASMVYKVANRLEEIYPSVPTDQLIQYAYDDMYAHSRGSIDTRVERISRMIDEKYEVSQRERKSKYSTVT